MAELSNAKHERFCREYVVDNNGKQAAIRAGYSERSAESQASRLLSYAKVKARVAELQAEVAQELKIDQQAIVKELAKLGFSNMDDYTQRTADGELYTDFSRADRDKMAAVQEVTVEVYTEGRGDAARDVKRTKFKLADKRSALVDLGKHIGMWPTKVEHDASEDLVSAIERGFKRVAGK